MDIFSESAAKGPVLILHAGANNYQGMLHRLEGRRAALKRAMTQLWAEVTKGLSALDAVAQGLKLLESEPECNAGYGALVQRDGLARLSASVMDGAKQRFSGVMLATHVVHPSKLAIALQGKSDTVVGPLGAQLLARELGIPPENPVCPEVAQAWADFMQGSEKKKEQHATSVERGGTVGIVVLDASGRLAAGTSTGGTYMSGPERISDSATVAGNYASPFAAISCTGIGEQIVDAGLAVRLETRIRDGQEVASACRKVLAESSTSQFGWIVLSRDGTWGICASTSEMPAGVMSADRAEPLFT